MLAAQQKARWLCKEPAGFLLEHREAADQAVKAAACLRRAVKPSKPRPITSMNTPATLSAMIKIFNKVLSVASDLDPHDPGKADKADHEQDRAHDQDVVAFGTLPQGPHVRRIQQ